MVCFCDQGDAGIGDGQHQMLIQEADHYELLTRPQGNAVFNPERRLGPTLDAASQSIAFEQRQSQKNQAQDQ